MQVSLIAAEKTFKLILVEGSFTAELDLPVGEVAARDFAEFANHLKKVANQIYHNHKDEEESDAE